METSVLIKKLISNKAQAIISFIGVAYIEFKDDENELSRKVKWYLQTAELIINEDDILSKEEKDEFSNLHLAYIKKINTQKIKIPLNVIIDKFEKGIKPIDCLTKK